MLVYSPSAQPQLAAIVRNWEPGESNVVTATGASSTATMDQLTVGATTYRLLKKISFTHWWDAGQWAVRTVERRLPYIGKGETLHQADDEWHKTFHADFQRLYAMRPFEMASDESNRWSTLVSLIDVAYYRDTTPVSFREMGRISWGRRSYPTSIRWIDGRKDGIPLDSVPEIASCKPGQWIEAVVEREPATGGLIRITHVERMGTPAASRKQVEEYWTRRPAADLPVAEWTWPNDEDEQGYDGSQQQ